MLEAGGSRQACGSLELADELPAVERIQKINVTRTTVENCDGQFLVAFHKDS